MKSNFFINTKQVNRSIVLCFIILFFSFKLVIAFGIYIVIYLFLFRKRSFNQSQSLGENILVSPVFGKVSEIKENQITIRIRLFDSYGISMPTNWDIKNTIYADKEKKLLRSINIGDDQFVVQMSFSQIFSNRGAVSWVASGDKAQIGAFLGYLPFGGKVVIQLPEGFKTNLEVGTKISSSDMLASKL